MALVVAVYLGASGEKGQISGQTDIVGVATLCSGVKKEALDMLQRDKTILKTTEDFLKAVLRHYKVGMSTAAVQKLLHARAKLYYRIGRLLQGWPRRQVVASLAHVRTLSFSECASTYAAFLGSRKAPRFWSLRVRMRMWLQMCKRV